MDSAPAKNRLSYSPSQLRIASVRVTSANPELDAWKKLKEWAESKGLLRDPNSHPVFGYTCQPHDDEHLETSYDVELAICAKVASVKEAWITEPGNVGAIMNRMAHYRSTLYRKRRCGRYCQYNKRASWGVKYARHR